MGPYYTTRLDIEIYRKSRWSYYISPLYNITFSYKKKAMVSDGDSSHAPWEGPNDPCSFLGPIFPKWNDHLNLRYFCVYIYMHTYIYRKERCQVPIFPRFWKCSVFCYIMFNPLCSYTCDGFARDPHRLSDFLRGCQRMSSESWRFLGKRKEEKKT